ncbi:hypothetical protein [Candidatus Amarolinea dominans]
MESEAIARLQTKEAGEAIIERIQRDFQLAPLVALIAPRAVAPL